MPPATEIDSGVGLEPARLSGASSSAALCREAAAQGTVWYG
jgi:hypothetical protein